MKRFKFRLQTLLDRRKAKEEQLLWELGEIRRTEVQEIENLHSLEKRLDESCRSMEQALRENAPVSRVVLHDDYAKATRDDIRVQEMTIEAISQKVEEKRVEVVKAMQEKQVLEALKDKQEREYMLAVAREEQNQLDEMASMRYARGM
ncbi:MAG: flagellar export protein FliJ [Armatimonadetes bacterium]|nr:flagellar export protein FliJ [Armatimonadota bacterium]